MAAIPGHGTATITEWNLVTNQAADNGVNMTVDFDPQSLELTYSVAGPPSAQQTDPSGAQKNNAPAQQTSQSTSLTFTLVFDSTDTGDSVQTKTDQVVSLTQPGPVTSGSPTAGPQKVIQFSWGTFLFYGHVQSLSQTIDYFSSAGTPLRATVHLTLDKVDAPISSGSSPAPAPPMGFGAGVGIGASASIGASGSVGASVGVSASFGGAVGTTPLTLSASGDTVQSITAQGAPGVSWKAVAAANNIDNPRILPPGTVLDLSAGAQLSAGS